MFGYFIYRYYINTLSKEPRNERERDIVSRHVTDKNEKKEQRIKGEERIKRNKME